MYGENKAPKAERPKGDEITEYTKEDLEAMESRKLRLYLKMADDGLAEISRIKARSGEEPTPAELEAMREDTEALTGLKSRIEEELAKRSLSDYLKGKFNYKEINNHA